jgi:hypothetical protein
VISAASTLSAVVGFAKCSPVVNVYFVKNRITNGGTTNHHPSRPNLCLYSNAFLENRYRRFQKIGINLGLFLPVDMSPIRMTFIHLSTCSCMNRKA